MRSATAVSKESCQLLGLFKPDLTEMIEHHPIVAAKLLQAVSMIIAYRLTDITREVKILKYKLTQLEKECETVKNAQAE